MVGCPVRERLSSGADLRCGSSLWVLCLVLRTHRWPERWERVLLEFPFKNRGEPRLSDGAGFGLTIAPRAWRQEITWQLVKASTAVRIASACSVRTGVRDEPLSLPNHMGQPIFAAARARARLWQPRRRDLPSDRWRFSRSGNARRPRRDRRRGIRREIGFSFRVMNQRPAAMSAPF